MKKQLLFASILLCTQFVFSQVQTDTAKRIVITNRTISTKTKTIPAAKAVIIRKDVVNLKLQLLRMSDSLTITKKEIDNLVDKMKSDLDSMSEMGEMESLRLQMAMDRLNKMMSTLSNILKKISDTAQQITQNIK
jgi:uncharacterized protein YukE